MGNVLLKGYVLKIVKPTWSIIVWISINGLWNVVSRQKENIKEIK